MTPNDRVKLLEENQELKARLAELEQELAHARRDTEARQDLAATLESILQAVPDFFFQVRHDGTVVRYLAQRHEELYLTPEFFMGKRMQDVLTPEVGALFAGTFPQVIASRTAARVEYELETLGQETWYEARVIPFGEEHLIVVVRNITEQRNDREALRRLNVELEERVRERTEALEAAAADRLALQQQIIEAQRASLIALSTPIVPIARHVVAVPIIGDLDDARAGQLLETILTGVQARGISVVLLDVTGVPRVDAAAAEAVIRIAQAVSLLGAELVLTGIGPELAVTLVTLGFGLGRIRTMRSLEQGIAHAMGRTAR